MRLFLLLFYLPIVSLPSLTCVLFFLLVLASSFFPWMPYYNEICLSYKIYITIFIDFCHAVVIHKLAIDLLHAVDYTVDTSKEAINMQKHYCGKCGSELVKNTEYASDFFECDDLLYDEKNGLRVTINTIKCPNYREFLTFSNGHTYKLCK